MAGEQLTHLATKVNCELRLTRGKIGKFETFPKRAKLKELRSKSFNTCTSAVESTYSALNVCSSQPILQNLLLVLGGHNLIWV